MARVLRTGWNEHQARLLRALYAFGDEGLEKGLRVVGAELVDNYHDAIDSGRSPAGRFRALSPAYAAAKKKRYGSQPILVATGAMRDSLAFRVTHLGYGRSRLEAGAGGTDDQGVKNGVKALAHIEGAGRLPVRDFGRQKKGFFTSALTDALRVVMASAPVRA